MPIFFCQKCFHMQDAKPTLVGKPIPSCPVCKHPGQFVYDNKEFFAVLKERLTTLSEQNSQLQGEVDKLKQQVSLATQNPSTSNRTSSTALATGYAFENLSSSPELSDHKGVVQWFEHQNIRVTYDEKKMDIAGHFDEIAVKLGDHYDTFSFLLGQITYHQSKGHKSISLDLSRYDQQKTGMIKKFCEELYDYAFVTRYAVDKEDKRKIWLSLQLEPKIVNFFNGEWLEWLVCMKTATFLAEKKQSFSWLKNFTIQFDNKDKHEIDLFFLVDKTLPLWFECKSGEFRNDIVKYTELRRRLKVDKNYFHLVALGLADDKAVALTKMFDITVVNEHSMLTRLTELLSHLSPSFTENKDSEEEKSSLWNNVKNSSPSKNGKNKK